ncbi:MAG TPA: hypothetical protein VJ937_09615 [Salinivirga sp.]|uniref:hypothetical protein n=1 Tax=Salinivirga sp. TaxID=1970192 RepID=UPI002B49F201|nr:hypothetical protein [Salinivirga sp.]HKK59725.1 hypothetical protein [Salinivirga sp.]
MEDKQLKYEFPYRIVELKTNSFSVQNLSDEDISEFNPEEVEFSFKPAFGFNEEDKAVKVNINVMYIYRDIEILKINVDIVYEFVKELEIEIKDKNILAQLLGIAFSTIRGIILNRTIGNFMNDIYLPIINPTEIVEDIFKEDEEIE